MHIFLSAKGKSSKKVVKEKEPKTESSEKESKGRKAVTVTEVAEVTEPLEVLETEEIEAKKAPEEISPEEIAQELRELKPKEGKQIVVGPPRLTRFEKARIIGARALQISLGAPPLMAAQEMRDAITLAEAELMRKALPISLRRILPNGQYQDIPIKWLLES